MEPEHPIRDRIYESGEDDLKLAICSKCWVLARYHYTTGFVCPECNDSDSLTEFKWEWGPYPF